ncbi:hypothetical protein QWY84_15990 [Aquisalimonas lutea]|uniref:hypothetical protein n=1 Tax=Aquisalimonas lutea TaxID=1327750 RepID=UPI0025B529EA|nr:hypothetical protein [Aquisalimonas lutea]MDN3519116.1 hypothetical protein [Aquisalimonas lutea]
MATQCSQSLQPIRRGMSMPRNQYEATVISEDELFGVWLEHSVQSGRMSRTDADAVWRAATRDVWPDDPQQSERVDRIIEGVLGNVANVRSGVDVARLMADFKGLGSYHIRSYAGERYIIFKGWPAGRSVIQGTRYLADNPKIVSMGIGRLGVKDAAKAGARLTFVLIGAYRVLQYLLDDKFTLTRLVGTLTTDILKISASAAFAALIGGTAATAGATVVGPLVLAIIVGGATSVGLDALDSRLQLTDRLCWQLENLLRELGRIDTWGCRARVAAENTLVDLADAVTEEILETIRRRGEQALRHWTGPHLYRGWIHMPVLR